MATVIQFFSEQDWTPLIQVLIAVVLGGIIGLEREMSGRPAGLRTHILVCVGATIIVVASSEIPRIFGLSYQETLRIDPGRIAAGIVTGIGFLGAGAILRKGSFVRGLTTAACIWFAAALGIVIGLKFYFLAAISTLIVVCVLRVDELFEARINSPIYKILKVKIDQKESDSFAMMCKDFLKKQHIRVQDLDYSYEKESDVGEFKLYIRTRRSLQSREVICALKDQPGIISVTWEN